MNKLFLLDAYAIIYKAYYALFTKGGNNINTGFNTGAIYGFVNTLHEVISKSEPTHLAVCFDTGAPTFRHEEYPEYKAQREKTPEDIGLSVPYIKRIVEAYNIPILQADGFEADDVIGTMAKKAAAEGFETYMLTPDKDYFQLVDENIYVLRPLSGGGYDKFGPAEVCAKYSLDSPSQVIDMLGLMGDSSDNVPGCPGVGELTSVKLLKQYGSIENLLEHCGEVKGKLGERLEENQDLIRLSKRLVTIRTDVPMEFDEQALRLARPDMRKLNAILDELGFRRQSVIINKYYIGKEAVSAPSLFDLPPVEDSVPQMFVRTFHTAEERAREKPDTGRQNLRSYVHDFSLVDTSEALAALCDELSGAKEFCFDTETSSLDVFACELLGISFCHEAGRAAYVAMNGANRAEFLEHLAPLFAREDILKIGHNCKFDLEVLAHNGVEVRGPLFDTMVAHYLVQPEMQHGMDLLAQNYLEYDPITYEDLVGPKGRGQKTLLDVPVAKVAEYSAEDAEVTLRLKAKLEKELERDGLKDLFWNVEMPLVRCLMDMETAGVRIDSAELAASSAELTRQMNETEQKVIELAGKTFNLNSPRQLSEVLYVDLGLRPGKKTKTGGYSTDEKTLEELASAHPIINLILDYRKLKKLLGTYIDALPQLVNPETGKIHTSFNQCVTATGRLSSTNPNLQNIPVRDALGKEIRKCFIPDDGCIFLSADYSQIELRLMAHMSGDENMRSAFVSGEDIHADTASKIYKLPLSEVTKDMRRTAKTANFGIIYGITGFGLGQRLGVSRSEAEKLISDYFESYPGVRGYIESSIEGARERGYVLTLYGRRRYLPDINSQNSNIRKFAERNAVNAPIQGSAADIIKMAMVRIWGEMKRLGLRSQMLLQVHDELNFNVYPDELEQVKAIVKEGMETVALLSVPLVADIGTGANWLESH